MEISQSIMMKRIFRLVSNTSDYRPTEDPKHSNVIGYYNAFYHETGFCMIYPPSKNKKIPTIIVGYEARDNGNVYCVTQNMKRFNLSKCLGCSIKMVYQTLIKNEEL